MGNCHPLPTPLQGVPSIWNKSGTRFWNFEIIWIIRNDIFFTFLGMPWLEVVKQDINKLYWTESIVDIEAETIEGLCYILPENKIQEDTAFEWTQKGLLRFYYSQMFNAESRTLESMNEEAENFEPPPGSIQDFPMLDKPLNMLDVFAGCGGLSIGLEQSGVAITEWAIEWEKDAAKAFEV